MAKHEVSAVRPRPHGRTGRFEAGVCIQADGYGGYCASIYLRVFGDLTDDEVLAHLVHRMDSERTFELAAEKADSWARAIITRDFSIRPELLDVNLMRAPVFV